MIRRTLGILLVGNSNGVQGLGAGVLSVGRGMVHHFLRMKVCQLVDLQEHTSSVLINIRAALSRIVGEDSKVQRVKCLVASAAFRFFFFESQRRHFSRSSAGKDDLVCLRVGLLSIDSRGTLVTGPSPSSSSSRQCRDISNFPGVQGSLSKVDSNTMIRKVQKEHVPETESDCKTRSNFRALFYRVSRAFGCDQNVHVALVTRGAWRSTRNLPYVTITHSYVLAFFATRLLLLFRSHFCRNCSFNRRYQHDLVLELFPHFGRRTKSDEQHLKRKVNDQNWKSEKFWFDSW